MPESTTANPKVFRLLDASTSHLPQDVCAELNSFPGVIADERPHGWLLWVPESIDQHLADYTDDDGFGVPDAVVAVWRSAAKHDCQYVLLDQDANVLPDLPTYD